MQFIGYIALTARSVTYDVSVTNKQHKLNFVTCVHGPSRLPCRLWGVGAKLELELGPAGLGCSDWEEEERQAAINDKNMTQTAV